MNQSNYFNLYDVWVNELVGDVWLMLIVGLIIINYLSVKAKIPYQVTVPLNVMFIVIMFSVATQTLLVAYVFAILGIGTLFYYIMSKRFRQG